jgi:large subunit ribosomal protein L3
MGGKTASTLNLKIIRIVPERGLIFVNGSVPGATNGTIQIRKTKRRGGRT